MVAAPCRALAAMARWNGQAPQVATGVASVSETHCQAGNWAAGTMASTVTGTASATETTSRRRATALLLSESPSFAAARGGAAVYPVRSTTAMRSATVSDP